MASDGRPRVPLLRFDVGERVRCKVGPTSWAAGAIVATHYREDHWKSGRSAPYQVELDDGDLIFAPVDTDELIRSEETFHYVEQEERERGQREYREDVASRYPRKHPALFEPLELPRFLDPRLRVALQSEENDDALRALWTEEARGLYSLRFVTDEFCTLLLDEVENFEAWCDAEGMPLHRPNVNA